MVVLYNYSFFFFFFLFTLGTQLLSFDIDGTRSRAWSSPSQAQANGMSLTCSALHDLYNLYIFCLLLIPLASIPFGQLVGYIGYTQIGISTGPALPPQLPKVACLPLFRLFALSINWLTPTHFPSLDLSGLTII